MGSGRRRPADPADRRRHRRRSRGLTWLRAIFGARPISILDVLLGAVLAVTAYGGVAAVAFVMTMPPFAEFFAVPRWTAFTFFTAAGMALTSTVFQAPLFLFLILILRRRRAAGPVLILIVGSITGALAGLIFTYLDGTMAVERLGDFRNVVVTTFPVGFVLAVFVLFAAWLRRRLGALNGAART